VGLKETDWDDVDGIIRFETGSSGRILWIRRWDLRFHKIDVDSLITQQTVSFFKRTVLQALFIENKNILTPYN